MTVIKALIDFYASLFVFTAKLGVVVGIVGYAIISLIDLIF